MSSHLTRHVFRRLLANEPIVHRGCLRRRGLVTALHGGRRQTKATCQDGGRAVAQQRSFFDLNMFRKPKRALKDPDMVAGIDKMRELEKLQRLKARLPPQEDILNAVKKFVAARQESARPLDDIEASLLLRSIRYSQDTISADHELLSSLLKVARARAPKDIAAAHVSLAFELREMLKDSRWRSLSHWAHNLYIRMLCLSGDPDKAKELHLDYERSAAVNSAVTTDKDELDVQHEIDDHTTEHSLEKVERRPLGRDVTTWSIIIDTYARFNRDLEVQDALELAEKRGLVDHSMRIPRTMLLLSLQKGDLSQVQAWWNRIQSVATRTGDAERISHSITHAQTYASLYMEVLRWCAKNGHISFGHDVVREILQRNPLKPIWDTIFVWAAATAKGVDEIGRMIVVMESTNDPKLDRSKWRQADIATINALVEYAISKEDPYMAERFIALGRERGIEPDAKTYVLQMDYRLSTGDIDGALTAYKNLQSTDLSSEEDVPTVNKLIVALCSSGRHDFDTIMNVAADLSDRRARFDPQTVSILALLHLNRDEMHDVTDLLNTHAYHFSSAERDGLRSTLLAYSLDPQTPLARVWDAYTILREVFDELPRQSRTQLMSLFFKRERPDIAVHVFNHMRSHSREDTIPTVDTYVTAFMGAARLRDIESLELIHNQLKLDFHIDVSTHLRNALIIAYTACEKPRKALGFWDDIVASREGPSYNSIHVAFRACEHAHLGDLKAKKIWEKLRKMNIELDSTLWGSYIAAVAGQGDIRHAVEILAAADEKGELDVDEHVLGSLFMGTPSPVKQRDVEMWARDKYPQVWGRLVEKGVEELENGARVLKGIDRSVAP